MKAKWLVLVLVLCAVPAFAQQNLLGDIQAERAKYGPTMTSAEQAQLLNAVAWRHRGEGWGMLSKGSGNSCPIGGTFISCDILIHAPSVTHWDVLQGADPGGTAQPQFNLVGPCVLGPASGCDMGRFLAPMDTGVPPPIQPPAVVPPVVLPPPVPSLDLSAVLLKMDAQYLDLVNRDEAQDKLLLAIQERLIQHDEQPMWIMRALGNRYVQAALGVLGGLVVDRFGLK